MYKLIYNHKLKIETVIFKHSKQGLILLKNEKQHNYISKGGMWSFK